MQIGEDNPGVVHIACLNVHREESKSDEGRQKPPLDIAKLQAAIGSFEQKRQRVN